MIGVTVVGLGESTVSVLPLQSTTEQATVVVTQFAGLAVFAGTLAALSALVYRWASREQIPVGLALLFGLSGVAVYLNTTTVLGRVIVGDTTLSTDVGFALFNVGAFLAAGGGAVLGRQAGDRFGTDVFLETGASDVDEEVNRLVRTVGRVIVVTLPDEVDDVVGYDPVAPETKQKLAGKRFLFPRSLTVGELRERLVSRLKTDYGVGTVDLELGDDGTVTHLGVGSRAAGIGPTLPPATNAVAVRADPAFAASAGDIVQVWETEPMRRVCTAELRGVAADVVTLAIDTADTPKIDPRQEYRLVTLPVEDRPEREFAALLRAADETSSTVTVEAGSPLHGLPVGALDLTVIAVEPEADGAQPVALPDDDRLLAPGDRLFVVGRPEGLRRLEQASRPLEPSLVAEVGRPSEAEPSEPETPAVGEPILDDRQGEPPSQSVEADDTAVGVEPGANGETGPTAEAGDTGDAATAGESTFDELKAEFESGEADREADSDDEDEPIESVAGGSSSEGARPDDTTEQGESSFDELKAEFESGEADWEDEDEANGGEPDDLVSLEDAEISFDDEADDDSVEFEDSDDGIQFEDGGSSFDLDDEEGDDLLDLDLEDKDDELSFDEDADDDSAADEDADDDDDDDDDEDDSGGGSTFAQLKEEFESGEADWEDEISDSPGGDMRLDE